MLYRFLTMLLISLITPYLVSGKMAIAAPGAEKRLPAKISRVFDGSSFQVGRGLRGALIGVAAPDLKSRGGKEAFAFLRALLEGKTVFLEIDKKLVDEYGQARYYVFLEDGTFVNSLLLLRGYARAVIKHPNIRHKKELLDAEKFAKSFKRGIWGNDFPDPAAPNTPPDQNLSPPYLPHPRGRRF